MKTARYRKKCFDQIDGITASNRKLTAEVESLRHQLEAADQEKAKQEAQNQNLVIQLNNKEQEKTSKSSFYHSKCLTYVWCIVGSDNCNAGLEAEVVRLREEKNRIAVECGRLTEENKKLAHDQSQLQDSTTKMKEELKSKYSRSPCLFCCSRYLVMA